MSVSDDFLEFARDLFAGLGPVRFKKMFGGVGVYADELMFALGDDDALYLKVDDVTEPAFVEAGSQPFTYGHKDGRVTALRYWRLPDAALDDPDEAAHWGRLAIAAAQRATAAKGRGRRR